METYAHARKIAETSTDLVETLTAHATICRADSHGGIGSMALALNQSAALSAISQALAILLAQTRRL